MVTASPRPAEETPEALLGQLVHELSLLIRSDLASPPRTVCRRCARSWQSSARCSEFSSPCCSRWPRSAGPQSAASHRRSAAGGRCSWWPGRGRWSARGSCFSTIHAGSRAVSRTSGPSPPRAGRAGADRSRKQMFGRPRSGSPRRWCARPATGRSVLSSPWSSTRPPPDRTSCATCSESWSPR